MQSKWFVCVILAAAPLAAQEFADLQGWMKNLHTAQDELKKEKTGKSAVANAEKMGAIFENMTQFWRERGVADAVKASQNGKAAAVILASAANGGNTENAEAALKDLGATCTTCHTAHRTKSADGKYHMK